MTGGLEEIVVEAEGLTLDLIVWRRFRKPSPGLVEQVLALNMGLAESGPVLPRGARILMPAPSLTRTPAQRPVVQLWD